MNIDTFVENYLKCSYEHMQCTFTGDYKNGNRYAKRIIKSNAKLEKTETDNKEVTDKIIDLIIDSEMPSAIMWITPVCAKLQYRLSEIKNLLFLFSQRKDLELCALDAERLLEQLDQTWNNEEEKGNECK